MRHFLFENDGSGHEEITEDAADNYDDDQTQVQVETRAPNWFVIECTQYYARSGVCRLEITQPLERALDTFGGLLAADFRAEGLI